MFPTLTLEGLISLIILTVTSWGLRKLSRWSDSTIVIYCSYSSWRIVTTGGSQHLLGTCQINIFINNLEEEAEQASWSQHMISHLHESVDLARGNLRLQGLDVFTGKHWQEPHAAGIEKINISSIGMVNYHDPSNAHYGLWHQGWAVRFCSWEITALIDHSFSDASW